MTFELPKQRLSFNPTTLILYQLKVMPIPSHVFWFIVSLLHMNNWNLGQKAAMNRRFQFTPVSVFRWAFSKLTFDRTDYVKLSSSELDVKWFMFGHVYKKSDSDNIKLWKLVIKL